MCRKYTSKACDALHITHPITISQHMHSVLAMCHVRITKKMQKWVEEHEAFLPPEQCHRSSWRAREEDGREDATDSRRTSAGAQADPLAAFGSARMVTSFSSSSRRSPFPAAKATEGETGLLLRLHKLPTVSLPPTVGTPQSGAAENTYFSSNWNFF